MPNFPAPLPAYDSSPDVNGLPQYDPNVAAEAVARLLQQYQTPNTMALVNAIASPFQDAETALSQLLLQRGVTSAEGAQLDVLGRIVGILRQGLTDQLYQLFLLSQVAVNKSSGGPTELYNILSTVVPQGSEIAIQYFYPASFLATVVAANGLPADEVPIIAQQLTSARAAGVGGALVYSLSPPSDTFTFDSGPGFDVGALAGVVTT